MDILSDPVVYNCVIGYILFYILILLVCFILGDNVRRKLGVGQLHGDISISLFIMILSLQG